VKELSANDNGGCPVSCKSVIDGNEATRTHGRFGGVLRLCLRGMLYESSATAKQRGRTSSAMDVGTIISFSIARGT
jgi:hypothetical protein